MDKSTENWLKIARYDLRVADNLFKSGDYIACVEKSHNALEKVIKALINSSGNSPSKVHDLVRLIGDALLENLEKEIVKFLDTLNDIYYDTRYPVNHDELLEYIDINKAQNILKETKRIFSWIEKKIY